MVKTGESKLRELIKKLKLIKAKDIMTPNVITANEDAALADIAEVMIKTRISGIPVMGKKGEVSGMITAGDLFLVMEMIKSGDILKNDKTGGINLTVKYAMSTEVIKIKSNTTLDEIIEMMKNRNVYTFPVFEKNKLVGVIGRRDIINNFYSVIRQVYY